MNCQIICQFYYLHTCYLEIVLIFSLKMYFRHNFLGVLPYFFLFPAIRLAHQFLIHAEKCLLSASAVRRGANVSAITAR